MAAIKYGEEGEAKERWIEGIEGVRSERVFLRLTDLVGREKEKKKKKVGRKIA